MTDKEREIGAQWLAILNAYSSDFGTKSLFNQTANYLKTTHNGGGKKISKFQKEEKKGTILTQNVQPKEKTYSLLEAAKVREQNEYNDEEAEGNLLAFSETEDYQEVKKAPKKSKNV